MTNTPKLHDVDELELSNTPPLFTVVTFVTAFCVCVVSLHFMQKMQLGGAITAFCASALLLLVSQTYLSQTQENCWNAVEYCNVLATSAGVNGWALAGARPPSLMYHEVADSGLGGTGLTAEEKASNDESYLRDAEGRRRCILLISGLTFLMGFLLWFSFVCSAVTASVSVDIARLWPSAIGITGVAFMSAAVLLSSIAFFRHTSDLQQAQTSFSNEIARRLGTLGESTEDASSGSQEIVYLQKNNHLGAAGWLSVGVGMVCILSGCMLAVAGMQLTGLFLVFNGSVGLNVTGWMLNKRVHKNTVTMLSRLVMLDEIDKKQKTK